jgi:23S rRNA pseudouridine955/2504/2580 synthase
VHFYSIGHPIAGDTRYGEKLLRRDFPRLMLHASEITFALPSGQMKTIVSPLPASFTSELKRVGFDENRLENVKGVRMNALAMHARVS